MKKIRKVVVPATTEHVNEYTYHVCDLCGKERLVVECSLCKREVCESRCVDYDPEDPGDYPAVFCLKCFDLRYKKYQVEFGIIEQIHDDAIDELVEKIKQESLKEK